MKLFSAAAVALFAVSPAFAASDLLIDFENSWNYENSAVNGYYNGGLASDGTTGANLGVDFSGVYGLSNNDGLGPLAGGAYYANAPTPLGTAYVDFNAPAFMNVAVGVSSFSFYYASSADVLGAVRAYSGLNGTGSLVGTLDLTDNDNGALDPYTQWSLASFSLSGTAQSFDFSGAAGVGLDNITVTPVPEPTTALLMAAGLAGLALVARRRA